MTANQIAYQRNVEEKRANMAREAETNRANLANEKIGTDRNIETARNNRAVEYETNRSNIAKETETNRSNLEKEAETRRHNVSMEGIDTARLAETKRSNLANEAIGMRQASIAATNAQTQRYAQLETARANSASEKIREDTRKQDRDIASMNQTLKGKEIELNALNSQANLLINQQKANSLSMRALQGMFPSLSIGGKD